MRSIRKIPSVLDSSHLTSEYRKVGGGCFADATASSGDAAHRGYGMGVGAGDFDGDGDEDLYVANFGLDVLLLGDGTGRYADRST